MMDCTNGMKPPQILSPRLLAQSDSSTPKDQNPQRRSANYKPNIWKYDLLQSLTNGFSEENYACLGEKLKEEVVNIFVETEDLLAKLELIDIIEKLGLACLFNKEIHESLETTAESIMTDKSFIEEDLYVTSLCFRLLRQHGYNISQDVFKGFMESSGIFINGTDSNAKAMLELFEASNLATEGEYILDDAKNFTIENLRGMSSNADHTFAVRVATALQFPLRHTVDWYNVKRNIQNYEKNYVAKNPTILKLAKINFNVVQAKHQQELKHISRWWNNLGITEHLSFTRDRIVESFLWSVGVAFETIHGSLRKWLTKVIKLIVILDDVYDVYGSLQELELFTSAVNKWDSAVTQKLPECMKICYQTLSDTTNEIAMEMKKEKNWNISVLPHLRNVWGDFCNALLLEARWYNMGYTPSLQEYLDNGWITSSGPVLSLHIILAASTVAVEEEAITFWRKHQDLVYNTSVIIRLSNDQKKKK